MRLKKSPLKRIIIAVAFLTAGTVSVNAQTDPLICQKLEAQLTGSTEGLDPQSLAETLKMQRIELAKVRGQAAVMNCIPHAAGNRDTHSSFSCQSLLDAITTMEDNLRYYEDLSKPGNAASGGRQKILTALTKNNCQTDGQQFTGAGAQDQATLAGQDPIETGSVIEFGNAAPQQDGETLSGPVSHIVVNVPESLADSAIRGSEGNFITMCVRTCDGYYFPISYSSGMPNFGSDADQCHSRCPNADVELYYHSVPDQESKDMISLSGKKYTDQPFAFKYRKEKPGENLSCSCKSASDFTVIGGANSINDITLETGSVKPTAANKNAGGDNAGTSDFAAKVQAALDRKADDAKPVTSVAAESAAGRVRVVGPRFFPDPKEGAILRSPGPNPGQ